MTIHSHSTDTTSYFGALFSMQRTQNSRHKLWMRSPAATQRSPRQRMMGWDTTKNMFAALRPERDIRPGCEHMRVTMDVMLGRGLQAGQRADWREAEDHFRSAIWMAIVANDAQLAVVAGARLAECYHAAGAADNAYVIAKQLIPIAALIPDWRTLHVLITLRNVVHFQNGDLAALANDLEIDRLRNTSVADSSIDLSRPANAVYEAVASMLGHDLDSLNPELWLQTWRAFCAHVGVSTRFRMHRHEVNGQIAESPLHTPPAPAQ
jgi:hypothetical protein